MKGKKKLIVIIATIIIILVAVVTILLIVTSNRNDSTTVSEETTGDEFVIGETIDAEQYFKENSQIIEIIDAKDSSNIQTESEARQIFNDRGFEDCDIIYNYDMNGEYLGEETINNESLEKHPSYFTYYISSSEEYWSVFLINGKFLAVPLTYNSTSSKISGLIISEDDTEISYDGPSNSFFINIPNDSLAIIKTIERIDASTLNELTVEEIDK